MRVYITGPMTGLPLFNFPAFDEAATRGRAMGLDIVSPADLDRALGFDEFSGDRSPAERRLMIIQDVVESSKCDAIALLPGWERSSGAAVELALANFLDLLVLDARTFQVMEEWYERA